MKVLALAAMSGLAVRSPRTQVEYLTSSSDTDNGDRVCLDDLDRIGQDAAALRHEHHSANRRCCDRLAEGLRVVALPVTLGAVVVNANPAMRRLVVGAGCAERDRHDGENRRGKLVHGLPPSWSRS